MINSDLQVVLVLSWRRKAVQRKTYAAVWRMLFYLILVAVMIGCGNSASQGSAWRPPATFVEANIIGTWKARNPVDYTETLVMRGDHTFIQIYADVGQAAPLEIHGQWRLEQRSTGCVYIHLNQMRNFHFTTEDAANRGNRYPDGSPLSFWEPCEDTHITMVNKVTLVVGNVPNVPNNTILLFPRKNADVTDVMMVLASPAPLLPTGSPVAK